MTIRIVFETHSFSEDNELRIASGWLHSKLSERGQRLARELGKRRIADTIQAVFTSDLRRAVETAQIAFADSSLPILYDWRLRECDYGDLNGSPAREVHQDRRRHLDEPYPGGESWRQAVKRVGRFLNDLPLRWDGSRVLVIGHRATHFALEHYCRGVSLEVLVDEEFAWQEGWEYYLAPKEPEDTSATPSSPVLK